MVIFQKNGRPWTASLGHPLVRRLLAFSWGSAIGLALDFGVFSLLIGVGGPPLACNLLSSAVAITAVYFLVTRFSFQVQASWRTYLVFVLWYAESATVVSVLIAAVSAGNGVVAFEVKLASVPVTFGSNFLFGRWLFAGGAERMRAPRRLLRVMSVLRQHQLPPGAAAASEARIDLRLDAPRRAQRRMIIAAALVLLYAILVLPLTTAVSFTSPSSRRGVLVEHGLQLAFLVTLWLFVVWLMRTVSAVREGSVSRRRWLIAAAGYLAVNAAILLLVYPGYWVWDEFYTVWGAKQFSTQAWQGYLTNVFYSFGLFAFPSAVGILLLQMLVEALIVGYVFSRLQSYLRRPCFALVIALPLLSPVVMLNNLYPLRLTMYGYLLLLLVVRLLEPTRAPDGPVRGKALPFLGDCVLIGVLAFWRTEGIYLLALLPVAFLLRGLHRRPRAAYRKVFPLAAVGLVFVALCGGVTAKTADPGYQATGFINPLSTMLQSPLSGERVPQDLRAIDGVLKLDVLKANPQYEESPAFWRGALRAGSEAELPAFRAAFVDLVVNNPGLFLDNRLRAFTAANSMTGWNNQVQNGGVVNVSQARTDSFVGFTQTNFFVQPLNAGLKTRVELALLLWNGDGSKTLASSIIWNVLPGVGALVVLLVLAALRREWRWVLASAVVLSNAVLVFLTEPASYFMYFFPAYICSGVLIAGAIALAVDRAMTARSNARRAVDETPESSRGGLLYV